MIDRWYGITCDGCWKAGEVLESPSAAWTAAAAAKWTREKGWGARQFMHYCPSCSAGRIVKRQVETSELVIGT